MIRRSFLVASLAAGLSGLAHLGGFSALWSEQEVLIEGGSEASVARLGDSFRDVAKGELTPDSVEETLEDAEPETPLKPVEPEMQASKTEVTETPPTEESMLAETTPVEPVEQTRTSEQAPKTQASPLAEPAAPTPVLSPDQPAETAPSATPERTAVVMAPRAALTPTLPGVTPPPQITAQRPQAAKPVMPEAQQVPVEPVTPQTLAALPTEDEAAPILSQRPSLRPRAIEEAAAKRKPKPALRKQAQAKPKPKAKQPPRGDGKTAERRGTAQGQQQAKAQTAAAKPGRKAQAAGNAAASNYPGQVMRRIQRRKPRTNIRGTAVVAFSIAPSGALAALSLSKSSGSAKLDQLALSAVRRAAPFPRPPSGARTRFRLPVKGR